MKIKINQVMTLVIFLFNSMNATKIWLQNDSQQPIICNLGNAEQTYGHGYRGLLGNYDAIQAVSIKTTKFGSLFHNLMPKVKEVQAAIAKNPSIISAYDAVIYVQPSTFTWSTKVVWEQQKSKVYEFDMDTASGKGSAYEKAQVAAQKENVTRLGAFFRLQTSQQLLQRIARENLLGPIVADKVSKICSARYTNPNVINLCQELDKAVILAKQPFVDATASIEKKSVALAQLQTTISQLYEQLRIYAQKLLVSF